MVTKMVTENEPLNSEVAKRVRAGSSEYLTAE
jgi:hypothetical protein